MSFKARTEASKDTWETPLEFFSLLHLEFDFTLDAAASPTNCKVLHHYTIETDGLRQNWNGERVFINPPFSAKDQWLAKASEEQLQAECIVMLIPSTTDTRAWHRYVMTADEIRFVSPRLQFLLPLHLPVQKASSPTFPLSIIVWRRKPLFASPKVSSYFYRERLAKLKSITDNPIL